MKVTLLNQTKVFWFYYVWGFFMLPWEPLCLGKQRVQNRYLHLCLTYQIHPGNVHGAI